MAARWFLVMLVVGAGCKKKQEEPEEPAATGPAVGHSVTKKKAGGDEGDTPVASGSSAPKPSSGGSPLTDVTAISVGSTRACAISNDQLWCWHPGEAAENANA